MTTPTTCVCMRVSDFVFHHQSLLDTNKRTQAYACSTMSTLVDFAGDWVLIYLKDIVHHAVAGLRKYQIKSQIYMYVCGPSLTGTGPVLH